MTHDEASPCYPQSNGKVNVGDFRNSRPHRSYRKPYAVREEKSGSTSISGLNRLMSVRSNAVARRVTLAHRPSQDRKTILPARADRLFAAVNLLQARPAGSRPLQRKIPDVAQPSAPHAEFGNRDVQFEA